MWGVLRRLALVIACITMIPYCIIKSPLQMLCAFSIVMATRYRRRLWIVLRTLPRDLTFMHRYLCIKWEASTYRNNNESVPVIFAKGVRHCPNKVLLRFNDEQWTYKNLDDYSNRVAHAFIALGFKKGDTVALFMGNCPQYVGVWLGLSKIGVVIALINHNLRSMPLVHSIKVAKSRAVVFSPELVDGLVQIRKDFEKPLQLFQLGGECPRDIPELLPLQPLLDAVPTTPPNVPMPGYRDKLLYIYTSGTTGLPKAAILPHSRYLFATAAAVHSLQLKDDDVIYNPLPLYHTTGGNVGIGCALVAGLTVVIRSKFSASAYFPDCVRYNCTVAQYIGEMCRYVLAVPPRPSDREHRVRLMLGNGMRSNIWKTFVERFKIPNVVELYGATEGNANIVNLDNTVGAVGFLPQSLPQSVYPVAIIRVDLETGQILRNDHGFCDRCDIDEPGMFVGLISNRDPTREYHGYVDREASKKKIITDVFVDGDKYFLTGDILVMDELGYMYFKDRTGETFRWKGENISTAEVEAAINTVIGLRDVTVYGVEVPNAEGRAGMAAFVDPDGTVDLDALAQGIDNILPSYARPVFLRRVAAMEMTGTYKIKKYLLQQQSYDVRLFEDPVFFRSGNTYVPFDRQMYRDFREGRIRV